MNLEKNNLGQWKRVIKDGIRNVSVMLNENNEFKILSKLDCLKR